MSRLSGFFNRIFLCAIRLSPRWYFIAYVLTIPAFAWIYNSVPAGFYAPYARSERGGEIDAQRAAKLIQNALSRQLSSTNSRPHVDFVDWTLYSAPKLTGVRTEDGPKLAFWVNVELHSKDTLNAKLNAFSVPAVMTSTGRWSNGRTDELRKDYRYIELDENQLERFGRIFPEIPNFSDRILQEMRKIEVTPEEENTLRVFFDGISGDPTKVSDSYWRMCYLSAMTITTVGFGDIVPMAPLTRFFVALEAFLGIVLIGLFINALVSHSPRPVASP